MKYLMKLACPALWLILLSVVGAAEQQASRMQIWFGPLTWNLKEPGPGIEYTKYDFPALLRPDAPWHGAASHLSLLELSDNVVWSYPDLPSIVSFVKSHGFKFAFSDGMLFTGGACGKEIEGTHRGRSPSESARGSR